MKNKLKIILLIFFVVVLIIATLYFFDNQKIKKVQAGTDENVFGWAWSENIGWISFNNNTTGGESVNYGVNIGSDRIFSGYAWSENIGWISFNQAELSGCPSGACLAKVDLSSHEVSGWARALAPVGDPQAGGWDGWISLRGSNYGVEINNTSHQFEGWAWGGDDSDSTAVIGWISFNCNNPETPTACSDSDYKVETSFGFNQSPAATNLTVSVLDYCTYSLPISFSWDFSDPDAGDVQEYYQVQIDNNFYFSSIEMDSGKVHSSSESYMASGLSYNTTYYWRLKVWDDKGNNSGWTSGSQFTSPPHAYPSPDFTWSPSSPSVDEIIQLCAVQAGVCGTNQSTCYNLFNNPISCSGETFLWTLPVEAEFATTSVASTENPQIKFTDSGDHNVTLQITDDIGTCSITKQIGVSFPLPEWEETAP